MNNKNIVKNIGLSMIMKPISMLLSFVYTPMALAFLGEEKYGVWAIILNIVTWINIFDIGIGNGLRNRLAESYAKQDYDSAKKYVATAYAGTTILSLTFCIIINCVWNCFGLSSFFNLEVPDENVNAAIAISVVFVCVNFIVSLSKTSAYAVQKSGAISVTSAIGQVLQIIILYVISRIYTQSLIAVAVMYGLASVIESFLLYFYIVKDRSYLIPHIKNIDVRCMKSMMTLGIGFFVMQICSVILNTTDNLLISNLFGSAEVTPYSMVYKFFYTFVTVHSIILMPMWSAYTEAATKGDIDWIKRTLRKINLITLVFSFGVIIAIFVFEPFAAIWLGKKLVYGNTLIIIVAVYMIAQMFANNYSSFLCGVGYIKVSSLLAVVGAVINIPLSVLFAKYLNMRLSGIILGSLCVMAISSICLPIVSHCWLKKNEEIQGSHHE